MINTLTKETLKERLFGLLKEEPSDEIVSGEIRELIEKIFDEDGNTINWERFFREYELLMLNEGPFDSAVRATIISVLRKGEIFSLEKPKEDGNYRVYIPLNSGLGEENVLYTAFGQEIYFVNKDDAFDFADAFNKIEGEKDGDKVAEVYFIQKVTR
ncbi:MAG: hypothetical protein KAI57_03855 [Candidatus Pacebacteria bacterium]|nr:hypothetical protein [Candidatus Paceibacterota bacterium]